MKNTLKITLLLFLFIASSCGTTKKVAEVKKVDPLVGNWTLIIKDTPQGDLPVKMIVSKDDSNNYKGVLSTAFGDLPLENLKIENNKISAGFAAQGIDLGLSGTFKGTLFEGLVSGMGEVFTADGKKE